MRIVLFGQAAFGAKVLEALLEQGEEVVAAYVPPDKGGRADPVKDSAVARKVRVEQPSTYKDPAVFAQYAALEPELAVLAFVTDIIPLRFFEFPAKGAICYHPSLLPRHRGASAINWAVIMGDRRTGLSVFWPDQGIDTGPLLLQREVEIGADDTTGTLYFEKLFPLGVEAMLEAVRLVREGTAPRIPQAEAGATYEPPCDDRVAGIDFSRPAPELYNLVRGCDPQPGAFARWRGEKVRYYDAKFVPGEPGQPAGTVLGTTEKALRIALSGGTLSVGKLRSSGGKVDGAAFAAEQGLKPGDRFESATTGG